MVGLRNSDLSFPRFPRKFAVICGRKFEIAHLCETTARKEGTTARRRQRAMRVSVFTLAVLLVPYLPAAALVGGIAPRARLFSKWPNPSFARPGAFRARAPQPTLTAAKAAEPAKVAEPAKPRKATLSEWGTLLRLCSQARATPSIATTYHALPPSYTVRLTPSTVHPTACASRLTGQAARRLRLRHARARLCG